MPRKTNEDPTGQRFNRKRARSAVNRRLLKSQREVIALFSAIPRQRKSRSRIVNEQKIYYDYTLTAFELQQLENQTRAAINANLETATETMPPNWFYEPHAEQPYRQATIEQVEQTNSQVEAAIAAGLLLAVPRTPTAQEYILTPPYRDRARKVLIENYNQIKTLSEQTAAQVIGEINRGIQAGATPTEVKASIKKRFSVSSSSADRIVNTEVNKAYNDGKMQTLADYEQVTGVRTAVRHISALLPTTRPTHADRHRKVYTIQEQESWWNSDANRIHCYCSVEGVILNNKNEVISG